MQKSIEFLRKYSTFRTRGGKGAEFLNFQHCMEFHDFIDFLSNFMKFHTFATFSGKSSPWGRHAETYYNCCHILVLFGDAEAPGAEISRNFQNFLNFHDFMILCKIHGIP